MGGNFPDGNFLGVNFPRTVYIFYREKCFFCKFAWEYKVTSFSSITWEYKVQARN